MPKTYYLGFTKAGRPIGRESKEAYGYTHAALLIAHVDWNGKMRVYEDVTFSRTREGAAARFKPGEGRTIEVIEVHTVPGAHYRSVMKATKTTAG